MNQRKQSIADLLVKAPWWLSALLAVLAYVGLRWALPAMVGEDKLLQVFASGVAKQAHLAALLFGVLAIISALFAIKRRKLVDNCNVARCFVAVFLICSVADASWFAE